MSTHRRLLLATVLTAAAFAALTDFASLDAQSTTDAVVVGPDGAP